MRGSVNAIEQGRSGNFFILKRPSKEIPQQLIRICLQNRQIPNCVILNLFG
jgi:hypothetical protein